MTARDDVLRRIRSALGTGSDEPVRRGYRTTGEHPPGAPELLDLFEERLLDYGATVRRATSATVPDVVRVALAARCPAGARVVVPAGLDADWVAPGGVVDDGRITAAELDALDAVVTACAVAVADTGTIVLDASPDQGRRAISLVPDVHVCVVRSEQVVATLPEALRLLAPTRPLTFISGGSATSDIELSRVEGVHGPRTLEVVLVVS